MRTVLKHAYREVETMILTVIALFKVGTLAERTNVIFDLSNNTPHYNLNAASKKNAAEC